MSQNKITFPKVPLPEEFPHELKGWNWGAFLLNWVWGIGNSTYISLLMFIPGVNLIVPFVLGFKGNEWAWKNTKWENYDHFRTVQGLWTRVGIITYLGTAIFVSIVYFGLMNVFRDSDPYIMSMDLVRADSRVEQALGSPLEESGWMINGNLSMIDHSSSIRSGKASFSYSVSGPIGDGTVIMDADYIMDAWEFSYLSVTTKHEKITIINNFQ